MTAFDELRQVLPVPKRPSFADGDWPAVEESLGLALPADYKAFINSYGSGTALSANSVGTAGLVIHSPFIWVASGREIRKAWVSWASMYQDFATYGGADIPYPVFSEAGGLLPFGSLADAHSLNWLTIGEPEEWPFVYYHRDEGFFEVRGLSAVEFVLEAVSCRSPLLVQTGSESLFASPCVFRPYSGEEK